MPRLVPFRKYWHSSPLVFLLILRCHGLCGSGKYTCLSSVAETLVWSVSSPPIPREAVTGHLADDDVLPMAAGWRGRDIRRRSPVMAMGSLKCGRRDCSSSRGLHVGLPFVGDAIELVCHDPSFGVMVSRRSLEPRRRQGAVGV